MAFTPEYLAAVDAAILARVTGGEVEAYGLPDGTNFKLTSLADLHRIREMMVAEGVLVAPATARRVILASLRPYR